MIAVITSSVILAVIVLLYAMARMGTKNEARLVKTDTGMYLVSGEKLKELELTEVTGGVISLEQES